MWLSLAISLATFAQLSSALYPYVRPLNTHSSNPSTRHLSQYGRSASSLHSSTSTENDDSLNPSLGSIQEPQDTDDGAMRVSLQRRPAKRQNKFNIMTADKPTKSNSAGVDQDGTDFSYFASFKFGASSKTLYLLLDSAASNTWVMSSDCTTDACGIHTTFGQSDSTSLQISSKTFSVAYGTGSVKGVQGTDTVKLGAMSASLTFGLAESVSDEFLSYPMDGILGLGRPETLNSDATGVKAPSLLDALVSQKVIRSKQFGMALWRSADGGKNDGEINFGSPDSNRYDGDLNYITAVKSTNGFWEIPMADSGVDGTKLGITGRTAIIDSGTSFILMPQDDAAKLHKAIPNSSQNEESFTVPCDSKNKMQIVFGTVTYDISPKDYIGKPSGSGCASNIVGRQVFGPKQWLVGDVFMKNVYTVFDYDQQRVGFGVKRASASNPVSVSAAKSIQDASATGTYTRSGSVQPTGALIPGSSNSNPITNSVADLGTAAAATATATSTSNTGAATNNRASCIGAVLIGLLVILF
ncbi:acid protease [Venturia nashicola]|nr:acid protease [Venturia nashicola]